MVRRRSPFPVRSPRHAAAAPGALLLAVTIAALTGCSNPPPAGPASNRDAFWEPLSTTPVDSIATSDGRTRAVHLGIPYDTDAAGGARRLVEANLAEFGLTERHGLSPSSGHDLGGPDSPWGTVEVFRVDFQGVPVWGGEIRAIASDGMIRYLTVSVPRFVDLDITPALDPDAVLTRVRDEGLLVANDPLELVIFDRAFFADFHARDGAGGEPTLAYRVDAFDEGGEGYVEMFVSAVDGSVLYRSALGATARDRRIYNGAQRDQTCGVFPPDVRPMECGEPRVTPVELWFDESGRTDGAPGFGDVFDEAHALHSILGDIYDYWRGLLFLDSFDGRGAPLRGVVNFRDTITLSLTSNAWHFAIPPGPPTPEFPVAYDRTVLAFDPGMVVRDIVMHEYTHALTHHLSISKLHGEGQPASLNEAIGDMFAAFLGGDGSTWNIGEDSVISTMRSLSDPHSLPGRDWAPSCWAERFGGTEPTPECAGVSCAAGQACFIGTCIPTTHDDGGEHINATIVGHAMYLASEGSASAVDAGAGCDSEIEVRPLGTEKVQLFAATALLLVQRTTTFADHRENMDASCRLMAHHRVTPLGASSPVVDQDCISLRNAFARVGIGAADRDYDGVLDPLDACPEDPTQSEAGSDCADEPTDPPLAALDITVCQWQRHRVVGDGTFEDDFCDYDPSRPQTPGCDLRGGAPIRVGGSPTHPAFEAVDRVGFNNFTLVHRAGGSTRSFVIHATDPGAWLPERIVHGEYPTGTAPGWSFEGGSGMSDDNPLSPSGPSMHSATFRRPEIEGEISDVSVSFMLGSGRDCSMAE